MAFKIPTYGLRVQFTSDVTTVDINDPVNFTDLTVGATNWLWDFGDGDTSNLQNPSHTYTITGNYTVSLIAWKDSSIAGISVISDYITAQSTLDPDATIYLNAVVANGGTINSTISAATNTLFTELKSNSLYSKIDVMYPMLGSNAGGNSINAKNPAGSFNITWNGGMTFTDKGAIGNGSNAYGNTNYNAYTSSDPLNFGWGIYMYDDGNFGGEIYNSGAFDGTYISTMRGDSSSLVGCYGYTVGDSRGSLTIPTPNDFTGNYMFTFNSSQLKSLYRNYDAGSGTTANISMPGTPVLSNQPIYTHTLNINGAPYSGNYWNGTMSFYWIGESMSSSEITTLSTIINTFQTSLGRNTY